MSDLVMAGLILLAFGLVVVLVAMLTGPKAEGAEVKGGGVVMIGPIPIIFGSDARWATAAIVLALVLMLAYVIGVVR